MGIVPCWKLSKYTKRRELVNNGKIHSATDENHLTGVVHQEEDRKNLLFTKKDFERALRILNCRDLLSKSQKGNK